MSMTIGLIVIFSVAVYFMPAWIAACRNHRNATPILLTNLFFGWTGFGWFIALIWAFTS